MGSRTAAGALAGQVALVTGATRGIGAACAAALAGAGARVALNHRDAAAEAETAAVARRIAGDGGEAMPVRADVSDEAEVRSMFDAVLGRWGRLDILVANAGIQRDAPLHEMSLADWNRVIAVNLTGCFLCCREAAREFLRRGAGGGVSRAAGKIVCISSVHETIPWAGHANYAASKGGVAMLVATMAQELAAHQVRVNRVAPGAIRTAINRDAWRTPEAEARLLELIPYGRVGEVDDVARAVVWLASDASDYVNGACLVVDGGMSLFPAFRGNG
ncbi:MAG: glucose 1-dehydrogenase [Rubrivivax sp.]|nr:glucose 1-dehydrogenase [Rubrivivax sp.]